MGKMETSDDDFKAFCANKLFRGFDLEDLKILYSISLQVELEPGEVLIQESEQGHELFIITKGTLEVMKYDKDVKTGYLIDTLSAGDVAGEITFIDRGIRSASVRAQTIARVRCLPFDALDDFLKRSPQHSHIYLQLSKNITQRLRSTSNMALDALKKEVRENKARADMGLFLVYIITILCVFSYALIGLQSLISKAPNTAYVVLPMTLVIGASVLIMIFFSNLTWKEFGITLKNWKRAVFDGIVFPIPLLAICVLVKWGLVQFYPTFIGHPIFEPYSMIQNPADKTVGLWFAYNSLYWFIILPIEELLARGVLQGFLETFLSGKYRILMSILMSNLILSTVHLFLPIYFSLSVFFSGMFMGWIYSRSHNLISSWTAHVIIGTWVISLFGKIFVTIY